MRICIECGNESKVDSYGVCEACVREFIDEANAEYERDAGEDRADPESVENRARQ